MYKCYRCGNVSKDGHSWCFFTDDTIDSYVVCGKCLEILVNILNSLFHKEEKKMQVHRCKHCGKIKISSGKWVEPAEYLSKMIEAKDIDIYKTECSECKPKEHLPIGIHKIFE